jgi:hypothetical protein
MSDAFLHASPADILARIEAVAREAAVGRFVVRVGAAQDGFYTVGLDLPRERRGLLASQVLRSRLREGLERAGVVLLEDAAAPTMGGDLRGTVQVRWATRAG